MVEKDMNILSPGWNFDNTYNTLPKKMFSFVDPTPVNNPNLIIFNDDLAKKMGLDFSSYTKKDLSELFSGNKLPKNSKPFAQAYAGHQFGHFTMLGDGRATIIGEHITPNKDRLDLQYKGSGKTIYSRSGDGRASLTSMMREYLISESMVKIFFVKSLWQEQF